MHPRKAINVVAVTGASGFIGAHIVRALLAAGYSVHACVRNKDDPKNDFLQQLPTVVGSGEIRLFSASLLVDGAYDAAFAGCDAVIHVAAVLAITESQSPQTDMVEPSTAGTLNVLRSVDKCGARHYVHTSSVAAVGNTTKRGGFDENDWSDATIETSPYNFAKSEGERVVWSHTRGKRYTVSCINPTMVLGPCLAKPHVKASPYIFRQALYGNPYPNGPMSIVDVRDVAVAHVKAMELHVTTDRKRFIIDGDDEASSANDLIAQAARLFPAFAWSPSTEEAPVIVRRQWNNQRSKRMLGLTYTPQEQCIRSTVRSMVDNRWVPTRPRSKL